jgi:ribosomal 50S subunit-recycling heat shock protein
VTAAGGRSRKQYFFSCLLPLVTAAAASADCAGSKVRLDLFLKASRLCSRRSFAQKLCDAGGVSVNGARAKPAHAVKIGDEISIRRHDKLTLLRILSVPSTRQTSRKDAVSLYEVIKQEVLEENDV